MLDEAADRRTLVVIPTYDEAENIATVVARTRAAVPDAHILIVDDNSPDGTGAIADELARDPQIEVLHRVDKAGLGEAYVAAFEWALQRDFDLVVEMDADGSHPADTLPRMIDAVRGGASATPPVGLVIGSRWTKGGAVENWPLSRQLLSRGGNVYARAALGVGIKDVTGGYRVYRADVLRAIDLSTVDSHGYCFQIDLTLRTLDLGYGIVEVPIVFREREFGESKMSRAIVIEAMTKVTRWGIRRRFRQMVRPSRSRHPNLSV
ncbi:MAG TPA: polyprenol monophosphomannose synthase [Lacisediminihabitans sp.]|uniref:polyprenol monophosphomannose synthase n=1 Tax=Lacisediminihabitans sp. TaxID=2787631 RepID=UPI002EDB1EE5